MIHINELRIGNIVKCSVSNDAVIYKVLQLDGWMIRIGLDGARQGEWHPERLIKPIPLSPSVLLAAGFRHVKTNTALNDMHRKAINPFRHVDWDSESGIVFVMGDTYGVFEHIKHLHQLQNFWQSLTGEELNIDTSKL